MKLVLSDKATTVHLGIRHTSSSDMKKRSTVVWFLYPDSQKKMLTAEAKCYAKDVFCKRTGRKVAAQKLLEQLWDLPKADRRLVFFKICPEYSSSFKLLKQAAKDIKEGKKTDPDDYLRPLEEFWLSTDTNNTQSLEE